MRKLPFDFEDTSNGRPEAKAGEDAGQPGKPRREEAEQDKGNDGLRPLDDAGAIAKPGEVPDYLRKAYKITVTQP